MSQSISLHYELTEKTWRQFYEAHYAADHHLKIRFYFGAAMVLIGSIGLGGLFPNKWVSLATLLFGLYCVLSRQIFAAKSMRGLKGNQELLGEMSIRIDETGISGQGPASKFKQSWTSIIGYRRARPGFMFYLEKDLFFFIPRAALAGDDEPRLLALIDAVKLKRLPG
ncbi:hypothetical protein DESUT3_32130 [Desulfuromonas versatilis]|uniref:YcxB-like C-terminal domain-containing protein n=1 Tax=Desulfuromonas versatilis TaxID=2802975 RepID=A0ABM8HW40_9BACT|nr:YcxB family protein [Desulfuromonas versatilis]BCR06144.1 hypothetical protein DESUT3_32130 [Desulfuromonas versatilis]